jgi:hypothetical protein
VSAYKGQGDALDCGSYRGTELIDQVTKIYERLIREMVRRV